jgi:hypothetical protein
VERYQDYTHHFMLLGQISPTVQIWWYALLAWCPRHDVYMVTRCVVLLWGGMCAWGPSQVKGKRSRGVERVADKEAQTAGQRQYFAALCPTSCVYYIFSLRSARFPFYQKASDLGKAQRLAQGSMLGIDNFEYLSCYKKRTSRWPMVQFYTLLTWIFFLI